MTLLASGRPLCEVYDLALFDVDGVLIRGHQAVEHAAESLAETRRRGQARAFLTNNASREPGVVAAELTAAGIPAVADEVTTSSQAAAALLAQELAPGSPVLAIGGPGLRTALREVGFSLVESADDAPAAVVQGLSTEVGWQQLSEAALAVAAGARFLATNLDATLPRERGMMLGNGSLVAAVTNATGVVPDSAGKPAPAIFHQAALRAGAQNPLMIGDRLDTDLAGARAAGYPGLHVLTGVNDARDAVLAAAEHRPAYLAADLRGLLEPHPAPVRDADGRWRCGGAVAYVDDSRLVLHGPQGATVLGGSRPVTIDTDAWRCLAAAAWEAADAGGPVHSGAVPVLEVGGAR